ncbi:FAD-dependent monooxygenase [uncultured Roseobacter sp.]|uniref:FAD-dependent monooxygenase n=1 Tax=uncultured Roseobacter sp. TaxID=114847 RepID=UPI00261A655D|nr:FAD-dependent monooxygenase [uncultured Roseobacter sp.]
MSGAFVLAMEQRLAKNAVVIGAGIGGLACAAALAMRGIAVTLVEQADEITEVGAGLQISPNGLAVLRALGLAEPLRRQGAIRAEAVVMQDYRQGRTVARLDLNRLADRDYLFVHRADLIGLLARAARHQNVSVEMGRRAVRVTPGTLPGVAFADGGTLRSELIVCADGIHSVGRSAVWQGPEPAFTGQVAWRALVPARTDAAPVATVTMGPGRHVVSYPLRGRSLTNIVAVQERDAWADEGWSHGDDPENLRAAFADFGGPVCDLLDQVQDVGLWGLFRHPVAESWEKQGVALLGDAAHPTLPFLAQGANLALEDAWVLAALAASGELAEGYTRTRRARVVRAIDEASANARRYHLRDGAARQAAHLALSLGSRVAPGLMLKRFEWLYGHDVTATHPL